MAPDGISPPESEAGERERSGKSIPVAYALWFFLGVFGAHRFYTGRWVTGLIWLCTFGLAGLGYFFDVLWTYVMCREPK
jgi:TM2 domain-containing membrane protein YozV